MTGGKDISPSSDRIEAAAVLHQFQRQLQLITGWLQVSDDMIRHEIETAAIRQGLCLEELFIIVPTNDAVGGQDTHDSHCQWLKRDQRHEWNTFLKSNSLTSCHSGSNLSCAAGHYHSPLRCGVVDGVVVYLVPLQYICEGIFSLSQASIPYRTISLLVGINTCVNVVVSLYANRHLLVTSVWSLVYFTASSILLLTWYYPVACFMMTVGVDMYRQYQISHLLDDMLRISDITASVDVNAWGGAGERSPALSKSRGHGRGMEGGSSTGVAHGKTQTRQGDSLSVRHQEESVPSPSSDLRHFLLSPASRRSDGGESNVDYPETAMPLSPPLGSLSSRKVYRQSTASGHDLHGVSDFSVPSIDLTYSQNLVNWGYCRIVMSNVGQRFKLRIAIYTGNCVLHDIYCMDRRRECASVTQSLRMLVMTIYLGL